MKQEQRHKQIKGFVNGDREGSDIILRFVTEGDAQDFMNWLNEEGVLDGDGE